MLDIRDSIMKMQFQRVNMHIRIFGAYRILPNLQQSCCFVIIMVPQVDSSTNSGYGYIVA